MQLIAFNEEVKLINAVYAHVTALCSWYFLIQDDFHPCLICIVVYTHDLDEYRFCYS